ncbi:LuxR C-terminal-related transcriptional regulator [Sphingomonas sp. PP-CC-3G-468]|uniref:LuxR C-terminal-related transcriptional regulator n=1 Tax=Sphingomonas sp. PP-CC-3G-468 TaxID=2135656 RepID=UPI00104668A7|nr:LuxR C-terminal-related transcriptional regulator [Sphingomonas sp. PP-CC-3G-468]TCM02905.1 LuxR family maltose regulon positive regulatory protein [Sphingomonas sp. PP-CC-3G-468]
MTRGPPLAARGRSTSRRLSPPVQYVPLCERTLVLRSLEVARRGRLTVVLGPPGYGKTTALAQWHGRLRETGIKVAWCSASQAEREPTQFLRLLVLALEAGGIDPGPVARRTIGDASVEAMLDGIVLGMEQTDQPVVVIIDDYDRIDHPPIANCITDLLDALPRDVHLVLATRRKPLLAIATLYAQGAVRVIDPDELQLSTNELATTLGLPLDAPELVPILAQTEGWPVAVQLYRLWRQRVADGAVMPAFGGHAAEVADYLAEQVLAALPMEQQAVLITLSIAEQVEASFADAIREANDSAAMLEAIAAALPSLVQQTASEGEVAYRIHPLLSGYAFGRLALEPGRAALLYERAARWLALHDRYPEAVRHAVLSKGEAFLTDMLMRLPYRALFLAYGVSELRAILREIPPGILAALPRMQLLNALVLFKEGFFVEAEQLRLEIDAAIDESTADGLALRVESRALATLFGVYMRGTAADYSMLIKWLLANALGDPLMWGWCENILIVVQQQRGLLNAADASLDRTRHAYEAVPGADFAVLQLLVHDMLLSLARGALRRVQDKAVTLLRRDPTSLIGERCLHAMARMLAGFVDYQRSYRPQAAEEMRLGLAEYGREEAWFDQHAIAMPVIVDVTYRRHGLAEALRELDAARYDYALRGMICLDGMRLGVKLTCLVRAEALDGIEALEAACRTRLDDAPEGHAPWREREILLRGLCGLALARGRADEAADLANRLIDEGRLGGRPGAEVKGRVLLALSRQDDAAATEADMREAVRLASGEAIVAPFAEEGRRVAPLLRRVIDEGSSKLVQRHAAAILKVIDGEQQFADADALSDREAEIVAHLADGASNKLIARRLGLTENTIKFHLKKVYMKLGVSTRRQAVAQALQTR